MESKNMSKNIESKNIESSNVQNDQYWDDDERSLKMISYRSNKVEEQYISITKILKEMYEEDMELLYCNDSEYSFRSYPSYSNLSDDEEYSDADDNSEYSVEVDNEERSVIEQNANVHDFMYSKFCYV